MSKRAQRWLVATVVLGSATVLASGIGLAGGVPPEYATHLAPAWWTALSAALAIVLGVARLRGVRVAAWAFALVAVPMLWSASGVVFDLLRLAAVAGLPGFPPELDAVGMARRALAGATLLCLLVGTLRATTAHAQHGPWAVAAAVACVPYPALKVYWWSGGGWARANLGTDPSGRFPVWTVVLFALAGILAIGLACRRLLLGRVSALWPLLRFGAALVSAVTLSTGALAIFGAVAAFLGVIAPPASVPDPWPVVITYVSWVVIGVCFSVLAVTSSSGSRARRTG